MRQALASLAETSGSQVFLDRRINPATPVALAETGPPSQLLKRLADQHGWGVSWLAGVWYLGPAATATDLQTVHARAALRARSSRRGGVWGRAKPAFWPRLTTPTDALARLCSRRGISIANPVRVPHDLLPETRLPSAALSEQLTLLLVGFDMDWRPTSKRDGIEVGRLAGVAEISATHPAPKQAGVAKEDLTAAAPAAIIQQRGDAWHVSARVEEHEAIHRLLTGELRADAQRGSDPRELPASLENLRLTLTVKDQPLEPLLTKLTSSLELKLAIGEGVNREMRVSFSVREAKLEELIKRLRQRTGYQIAVSGNRLTVKASAGEAQP
ncbi:MAG: hypothetical protein AAGJ46_15915 [Planctomycetota bacterium]